MISFICNAQNKHIYRDRKYISGCQGWEVGSDCSISVGTGLPLGEIKKVLELKSGNSCATWCMCLMPINL